MNYSDMNLHTQLNVKTINIQPDMDINVLQFLPIEDKNDIITLTLQNSEENGVYNLLLIDMYFKMYITYLYTDINFSQEDKDDFTKLYNELESNGLLNTIISLIPESEYNYLKTTLEKTIESRLKYKTTLASIINSFIENLAPNAEKAGEIISNFNPQQFEQVMNFVKAINNGQIPQ